MILIIIIIIVIIFTIILTMNGNKLVNYSSFCFFFFLDNMTKSWYGDNFDSLTVFRLETDYPSETGYPLDNSGQIDSTS